MLNVIACFAKLKLKHVFFFSEFSIFCGNSPFHLVFTFLIVLVVRIARPTSLAIWHRGHSHRRPNRSGSPNRKHFTSLDLKKHAYFSHRRPTSQDFRRRFFWHFPMLSDQVNVFSQRKKRFRIALAIWECAIRIASHIAVASRNLGH